jgi:hypothetical protein
MTAKQKTAIWGGGVLSLAIIALAAIFIIRQLRPEAAPVVTGVVLVDDPDPQKQAPIGFATVTAIVGETHVTAHGDASGFFSLRLPHQFGRPTSVTLRVESAGYRAREFQITHPGEIQVLHLVSSSPAALRPVAQPVLVSKSVRVRYSEQTSITTVEGSVVKVFQVPNKGNVPCDMHLPCSPDGKWKATIGSTVLEGQGNSFQNVRISCIAGPCPFTRVESQTPVDHGQNLKISVLNWSETTTFLVEAEVVQTHQVEIIREAYAAVFGSSMNFTLPAAAQGATIEAEVGGHEIIYPMGPDLQLSWAVCSVKLTGNGTKQFHCDLKPEYRFK